MRIPFTLATLALLAATPALAQSDSGEQEPPKKVLEVYAEYTEIDLDGADVFGKVPTAYGVSLKGREAADFPSMIDERIHFKRDLAKSAGFVIKRSKAAETAPK